MNDFLNLKTLQVLAIIIWGMIGLSTIAKEISVFKIISEIGSTVYNVTHFFDNAEKRMKKSWETFDDEMREFDENFRKESEAFHKEWNDQYKLRMRYLGYIEDENGKFVYKEQPKKVTPPFSETQKEWQDYMVSCTRFATSNPDKYVNCLNKEAHKQDKKVEKNDHK